MFKIKCSKLMFMFAVGLGLASLSPVKAMDLKEAERKYDCKKSPSSSFARASQVKDSPRHSSSATQSSQPRPAPFSPLTDEKSIKAKIAELKAKKKKLEETARQVISEVQSNFASAQELKKSYDLFWKREKEFYIKFPLFKEVLIESLYLNDKDEPEPNYQTALVVYDPPWKQFEDRWHNVRFIFRMAEVLFYVQEAKMQELEKKLNIVEKEREELRVAEAMLIFDSQVLQRRVEQIVAEATHMRTK